MTSPDPRGRRADLKTFADLFCGIGGFHYALQAEGLRCVWACDTSGLARENYRLNHGIDPAGDIRDVDPDDLPAFDVLCAGFPCQPFSVSAARMGADRTGLNDPRGDLIFEVARIAAAKRPSVLLLENVPRLLKMNGGREWEAVRNALRGAGYFVWWSVLNASDFGIPQARKRLYIVGTRWHSDLCYAHPAPTDEPVTLADVMLPEEAIPEAVLAKAIVRHPRLQIRAGVDETPGNRLIRIGEIPKCNSDRRAGQSGRVYSTTGHAPTVTAHCHEKGERSVGGMYHVPEPATQGYRVYSDKGHAPTQSSGGGGAGANTGLFLVVPDGPRDKVGSGRTVFSPEGHAPTQLASEGGGQGGMFRVVPEDTPKGKVGQGGAVHSVHGHAPTQLGPHNQSERARGGMFQVVPADTPKTKVGHGLAVHSDQGHAATQVVANRDQRTQGGMYRRGGYVRVLIAREVARVMGFPDTWEPGDISERKAKSLLGNAVIPEMVRRVWRGIGHDRRLAAYLRWCGQWASVGADTYYIPDVCDRGRPPEFPEVLPLPEPLAAPLL